MPENGDLQYVRQRFRLLFDWATDGIWLADQNGRFLDVNPAACRILGYSREEHLRLTVEDLVGSAETGARLQELRSTLAQGGRVTDVWEPRTADGRHVALELSHAFTPDGLWQAIGRDISERRRAEARLRAESQRDREIVEVLQRHLLPEDLPAQDRVSLAMRYEPAVEALTVGGDWYDVVRLRDGRMSLLVGDVVGKGIAAAAVMGQLRSAARALLLDGHGPAQTLTALDTFVATVPGGHFSTVFCGCVDTVAGTVRYSSAGHPPPIVDDGGAAYRLLDEAQSVPLGVSVEARRPETTARLPGGSTWLLYTDGLVERRRQSIDIGINCAADILAQTRYLTPSAVADRLVDELLAGGHDDDVALLVYRQPDLPGNV
ncbi:PP2C family protein-serine/threonine phosphatase [Mycobacterium sp. Marseille-P9652]|uniref:PP2C family protein-serine/threonine phosphatase n=1 Tax=Mycobacterium sp. Marseille-P9652 TaxID=2654950 RepID=UPI0012E7DC31|nr:SpoIIE family protein phosphatase [Mycobacterium sp. Marseille-P9652]